MLKISDTINARTIFQIIRDESLHASTFYSRTSKYFCVNYALQNSINPLKSSLKILHSTILQTVSDYNLSTSGKWEIRASFTGYNLLPVTVLVCIQVTKHYLTTLATSLLVWFQEGNPEIHADFLDSCENIDSVLQSILANLSVTLKGMLDRLLFVSGVKSAIRQVLVYGLVYVLNLLWDYLNWSAYLKMS